MFSIRFVVNIEAHGYQRCQGRRLSVPQDVAWGYGWLDEVALLVCSKVLGESKYRSHLEGLLDQSGGV